MNDLVKESYYYTKNGVLLHGDMIEWMQLLPKESIDLILVDPPYNISKESNFHTMKDRKNQRTGTNFGEWDYDFSNSEWIKQSSRVLKKGGSLVAFNDFKMAGEIIQIATENSLIYKDTLIWHKTNPMPRNRDGRYIPNIEMLQWYVKKGKWTFNRQNEKYESCILSYPSESGGGFKRYYPTQKPIKIIEYLLKLHSDEGNIILDNALGSGTTAIACEKNNRKWIGIEKEEEYCDITVNRLKDLV